MKLQDELSKVYIDYTLENEFNINENTVVFIERQIKDVVGLMDSISFEMDTLRTEKDVLDLGRETDVYYTQLFSKKESVVNLINRNKNLVHLKEYVESSASDESLLPPASYVGKGDDYLSTALSQFYSKQLEKITMSKQVKPNHQGFEELISTIALQRKDLLIYIDNRNDF